MEIVVPVVNAIVVALVGLAVSWTLKGRFDALEKRMDGFERRMDGFERRLEGFEIQLRSFQASLDAMRSDLTQVALAVGARPSAENA